MAKRTGNKMPTVLRSLSPNELECIEAYAKKHGMNIRQFVGHARRLGADFLPGVLEMADHQVIGPATGVRVGRRYGLY